MPDQKNIVLFDDENRENLLPLTYTKPLAELRVGISTIKEKWRFYTDAASSYQTVDYLSTKYPTQLADDNLFINSCLIPDQKLVKVIEDLNSKDILKKGDIVLAYHGAKPESTEQLRKGWRNVVDYPDSLLCIRNLWDLFSLNEMVLKDDFLSITHGRLSQTLSATNKIIGEHQVYLEKGAKAECCVFNTSDGPVYIGRDAEIMEGSIIKGPFALCDSSTVKMGTKVYGATTIGPYCKVAGEIHNSIFLGYSNKAHDGFLGDSVIGEWCNLGAGTNNSNLKNNYAKVKLWSYTKNRFSDTGLQFCGLIMGDHSKCGINTMFNTGTVVGVSANIFGAGFPRNFIPSFAWGGSGGFRVYDINKAMETAEIAMKRRNLPLTENDVKILNYLFDLTKKYRKL
jgi:UDP-N-acetylglucosamine diphosphorylase/glucosamine-1-phosphate N-acetyltransferase